MIKITKAEYITGVAEKSKLFTPEKPMIAVCGKSNVGKSSFINRLSGNGKLARVSKEPGRTRLINYFDLGRFILADLPGYGYARVSKEEKMKWAKLLDGFFERKEDIAHVFALADSRHEPTADDRQMIEYLAYHAIPFTVVATKADKLSRAAQSRSAMTIASVYKCGVGNVLTCSAQSGQGFDKIFGKIEEVIGADV